MRVFAIAVLTVLLASASAEAETPPMFDAEAAYSSVAGPYVWARYVYATSLPVLHIVAGGEIGLPSAGRSLGDKVEISYQPGKPPSQLYAGAAADYQFSKGSYFDGYLRGAAFIGLADTQYVGMFGVSAEVDIRYLRLDARWAVFGNDAWQQTFSFSAMVRPYIQWLNLGVSCDSRDASADGQKKPCGVALMLYFDLPGTPIHLGPGVVATFFDLRGGSASSKEGVGVNALVRITIDY